MFLLKTDTSVCCKFRRRIPVPEIIKLHGGVGRFDPTHAKLMKTLKKLFIFLIFRSCPIADVSESSGSGSGEDDL